MSTRRLLFLDLETTGPGEPDPDRDWIVEFAFQRLDPEHGRARAVGGAGEPRRADPAGADRGARDL